MPAFPNIIESCFCRRSSLFVVFLYIAESNTNKCGFIKLLNHWQLKSSLFLCEWIYIGYCIVFNVLATHLVTKQFFNIIRNKKWVNLNLEASYKEPFIPEWHWLLTLVIGGHTFNLGETSPTLIQTSCLIFFYLLEELTFLRV